MSGAVISKLKTINENKNTTTTNNQHKTQYDRSQIQSAIKNYL